MNFNGYSCPMCETVIRAIGYDGKIHYRCRNCEYYCISGKVVGDEQLTQVVSNFVKHVIDIGNTLMIFRQMIPEIANKIEKELERLSVYLDNLKKQQVVTLQMRNQVLIF